MSATVNFLIEATVLDRGFSQKDILNCVLISCIDSKNIGVVSLEFSREAKESLKRKRPMSNTSKAAKQIPGRKDVQSALKDINLMPEMGNDLACSLCTYVATQKGNLKVHYKLKHLGGADLSMNCNLCQKVCTTKSNLKSHLISKHSLTREDASKLLS